MSEDDGSIYITGVSSRGDGSAQSVPEVFPPSSFPLSSQGIRTRFLRVQAYQGLELQYIMHHRPFS
jgi:hypothetical protein